MAWISPLNEADAPEGSRSLAAAHAATGGRYITGTTLVLDAGLLTR